MPGELKFWIVVIIAILSWWCVDFAVKKYKSHKSRVGQYESENRTNAVTYEENLEHRIAENEEVPYARYKVNGDTSYSPRVLDERDKTFSFFVEELEKTPLSDSIERDLWWNRIDYFLTNIKLPENADVLHERTVELWETLYPDDNIVKLHYTTLWVVNQLYKYREDKEVRAMILNLCDYEVDHFDILKREIKKEFGIMPNLELATKQAILLEKYESTDEAIYFCDRCIRLGIPDTSGYGTFEKRKEHLQKKLAKNNK